MCLDLFSEETPCSSILVGYHLPLATCTQSLDGLLREVRLYAESLCSESWIWHCNSIRTLNCAVYGVGQFFKDRFFLADSPLAVWVFGPRSVSWSMKMWPTARKFRLSRKNSLVPRARDMNNEHLDYSTFIWTISKTQSRTQGGLFKEG